MRTWYNTECLLAPSLHISVCTLPKPCVSTVVEMVESSVACEISSVVWEGGPHVNDVTMINPSHPLATNFTLPLYSWQQFAFYRSSITNLLFGLSFLVAFLLPSPSPSSFHPPPSTPTPIPTSSSSFHWLIFSYSRSSDWFPSLHTVLYYFLTYTAVKKKYFDRTQINFEFSLEIFPLGTLNPKTWFLENRYTVMSVASSASEPSLTKFIHKLVFWINI